MNSRWMRCMISILMDFRLALEPVILSITTGYNQAIRAAHGTGAGRGGLVTHYAWPLYIATQV